METNIMKFQQLTIGQKFEYQGEFFIKSSPLVASHAETGEQKLIPRYAAIVVKDMSLPPADKQPAGTLNSEQVQTAFNRFFECYLSSLQEIKSGIEAKTLESFQSNLDNARQQFLNDLGLRG